MKCQEEHSEFNTCCWDSRQAMTGIDLTTTSLTCLYTGGWVHSASDRVVHGWRMAGGAGGSVVVGNVYNVCSRAWTSRGWHRSPGNAPWWKIGPRKPPPPCPASESAACRRRHCWGPMKCCSRWQSAAGCCGWLAAPSPRGWRRWPTRWASPAPAGKGTPAEACSPEEGTRTGPQRPARSQHWGSRCAHLAHKPAPHLEGLWDVITKGDTVSHTQRANNTGTSSSFVTQQHDTVYKSDTMSKKQKSNFLHTHYEWLLNDIKTYLTRRTPREWLARLTSHLTMVEKVKIKKDPCILPVYPDPLLGSRLTPSQTIMKIGSVVFCVILTNRQTNRQTLCDAEMFSEQVEIN